MTNPKYAMYNPVLVHVDDTASSRLTPVCAAASPPSLDDIDVWSVSDSMAMSQTLRCTQECGY